MRDPSEYFHLPCKKRIVRLILLALASGGMFAGGVALAGFHGWIWWTGLMTGFGGLMLLYAGFYLLRGGVTLVIFVQQEETLFAVMMKNGRLGPADQMEYEEIRYSISVPVHNITHLWRTTTTVKFAVMSDALKICVAGKTEVLADLMLDMATVSDHDILLLGNFLQRYQPDLILSYP
jgi:hypothetical protein